MQRVERIRLVNRYWRPQKFGTQQSIAGAKGMRKSGSSDAEKEDPEKTDFRKTHLSGLVRKRRSLVELP